ncbi:MAG: hypothetical protein HKO68_15215 [Desulfobacterales bacterium]|nr:hypothetical protein [Desulfobacterales bacterium]
MKWIEVIMVRSVGRNSKVLASTLRELMNDLADDVEQEAIRVFRREKLDSDICIVLFHEEKKTKTGGSPLSQCLVAALQEFNLVYDTVWLEIEN